MMSDTKKNGSCLILSIYLKSFKIFLDIVLRYGLIKPILSCHTIGVIYEQCAFSHFMQMVWLYLFIMPYHTSRLARRKTLVSKNLLSDMLLKYYIFGLKQNKKSQFCYPAFHNLILNSLCSDC